MVWVVIEVLPIMPLIIKCGEVLPVMPLVIKCGEVLPVMPLVGNYFVYWQSVAGSLVVILLCIGTMCVLCVSSWGKMICDQRRV